MNKDYVVDINVAQVAHERGYPINEAAFNYSEENNFALGFNVCTKQDLIDYKIYAAPFIFVLQRWLSINYDLDVIVQIENEKYIAILYKNKKEIKKMIQTKSDDYLNCFNQGLFYTLNYYM